jgi:hypothetical protein
MAGIGATSSLPRAPAKVCLLNPQPALDLGDGDCSSCPYSDLRTHGFARSVGWKEGRLTLRSLERGTYSGRQQGHKFSNIVEGVEVEGGLLDRGLAVCGD